MWRFFYNCFLYLLQPFLLLFVLIRSLNTPNYRKRLGERYGFYGNLTPPKPHGIVVHAASVGEVIAATPLIRRIQQDYPQLPITITTFTPTGSDRVKATFGDSVNHCYLPLDLPDAVKRFLRFVQPKLGVVIETELWPNFIQAFYRHNIPFTIVNARLSARSAQRYGKIKPRLQRMLSQISLMAAQDKISAERYLALGYATDRMHITGNIKYDLQLSQILLEQVSHLKQTWAANRPVWIAASTHDGEDEIILNAHRQLLATTPNLLLLLVPRHPERFQTVADLIEKQQFSFVRRSQQISPSAETQVVLGDTMGELMLFYGIADIAFVGGSLIERGGHNLLEPAAFKLPVISGKHVFNFPEVFAKLQEVNGVIEIDSNSTALSQAVQSLLDSAEHRTQMGDAAFSVLNKNRGALQRIMDLLKPYLDGNQ